LPWLVHVCVEFHCNFYIGAKEKDSATKIAAVCGREYFAYRTRLSQSLLQLSPQPDEIEIIRISNEPARKKLCFPRVEEPFGRFWSASKSLSRPTIVDPVPEGSLISLHN
jgi:hypothetical protein